MTPEKRLVIAVLEDAIHCLRRRGSGGADPSLLLETEEWLMRERDPGPFSFENICTLLGLDPGRVRRRLLGD